MYCGYFYGLLEKESQYAHLCEIAHPVQSAVLIHDIGKHIIPPDILTKPEKLTDLEWESIKCHVSPYMLHKYGILQTINCPPSSFIIYSNIISFHHERFDGNGYPKGLKGLYIPEEARLMCILDSWDAMNSDRVYRPAMAFTDAVEEIKRGMSSQFDPQLAELFISDLEGLEKVTEKVKGTLDISTVSTNDIFLENGIRAGRAGLQ
jgi:HD-GYP domain-containing protein (c-di-GMP phosphodiesterase class II)